MGQEYIWTQRLQLRRLSRDDEEFLYRIYNDERVYRSYVCDPLRKRETLRHWLNHGIEKIPYIWLVEFENQPVGVFNCFESKDDSSTLEIGYVIDPKYWNQGFASEVLSRLLDYLFEVTEYHKLQASHFLFNPASGRVMEKAGMKYEGIRYDVFLFHEKYESMAYYYKLRD